MALAALALLLEMVARLPAAEGVVRLHVSPGGVDRPGCGSGPGPAAACAGLRYAVGLANAVTPLAAVVEVVLAPGMYGSASCGGEARRPLAVVGPAPVAGDGPSGPSAVIDCRGTARAMVARNTVHMSDVTLTGGFFAFATSTDDDDLKGGLYDYEYFDDDYYDDDYRDDDVASVPAGSTCMGGGAVAVLWDVALPAPLANFTRVTWLANQARVTQGGSGKLCVGGGALLVYGGGDGATAILSQCTFRGNALSLGFSGDPDAAEGLGGAVAVILTGVRGSGITAADVTLTDNTSSGCVL